MFTKDELVRLHRACTHADEVCHNLVRLHLQPPKILEAIPHVEQSIREYARLQKKIEEYKKLKSEEEH